MLEPIRVLHLVNQLTVGGSERQMFVLIRALDPRRVRSSVGFLRRGSGELWEPLRALGAAPREYSLGGSIARWNTVTQLRRIAARCRDERIDLIHAHDLWADMIGVAAARLAGVPIIISRRDLADFRPFKERCLLRVASRWADAVVVNAAAIRDLALDEGAAPDAVHVVSNGIDVAQFDREMKAPLESPLPARARSIKRAAVIGNMDRPHKGHSEVLVAASRLRARKIDWLLLSDGPLRPQLEQQAARLGVADRVHFLGRRRDVASILGRVDLLVHASSSEGFPNVVLEALCAALPVVATDVGATSELIRDGATGRLTPPGRPDALVAAISSLLSDWPRAARYGRAGRRLVAANFSIENSAARFERLYRACSSSRG